MSMQHVTHQHRWLLLSAASHIIIYAAQQNTEGTQIWRQKRFHWSRAIRSATSASRRSGVLEIDNSQLANGLSMPTIHLGVYQTSGKETSQAIRWALEVCFLLSLPMFCVLTMLTPAGWISWVSSSYLPLHLHDR